MGAVDNVAGIVTPQLTTVLMVLCNASFAVSCLSAAREALP
jgi:hypothetical protein